MCLLDILYLPQGELAANDFQRAWICYFSLDGECLRGLSTSSMPAFRRPKTDSRGNLVAGYVNLKDDFQSVLAKFTPDLVSIQTICVQPVVTKPPIIEYFENIRLNSPPPSSEMINLAIPDFKWSSNWLGLLFLVSGGKAEGKKIFVVLKAMNSLREDASRSDALLDIMSRHGLCFCAMCDGNDRGKDTSAASVAESRRRFSRDNPTLKVSEEESLSRARRELEDWNAFLIRHAQRLERCHNLLFGLCYLEGTPSIRQRCEDRLAAKVPMCPWIRATSQWLPPADEEPSDQIEVRASFEFPAVTACALAPAAGIAFIAERLGHVARVDLRSGRRLEPGIDVRRERPLQMACSEDGRNIALAFESGGIDVFQTEPGAGGLRSERSAWSARCRLPDFEAPALEFIGDVLWRQDEAGDAVACDADSGDERLRLAPPAGLPGAELTTVTRVKDVLALAWRAREGSGFISVAALDGVHGKGDIEVPDVIAMTAWGEDAIAVACGDNCLRFYALLPELQLREELRLDAPAACLSAGESRLWWISRDGEVYSWAPPAVQGERVMSPGLTFAGARAIALSPDEGGLILTSHSAFSFRPGKSSGRGVTVQAAALRPAGYVAVATLRGHYLVIDGVEKRTTMLAAGVRSGPVKARADGREVGYLFAVDGGGRTLVGHNDICELVDPSTGDRRPCNVPEGVISAVGSVGGGFWLADILGHVFYLDTRGIFREAALISSELLGPPRLSAWASLVVWSGMSIATKTISAPDPICLQVFFRVTSGRLERLGSREYAATDGIFRTLSWDEGRGRLIGIWQGRVHGAAVAKIGTPDELIAGSERERLVPDLATDCESAAMGNGWQRLFVLTADGAIRCFDADTLAPMATIAGSLPFTSLSERIPARDDVVAVAGRERILLLNFEEGG